MANGNGDHVNDTTGMTFYFSGSCINLLVKRASKSAEANLNSTRAPSGALPNLFETDRPYPLHGGAPPMTIANFACFNFWATPPSVEAETRQLGASLLV